MAISAGAPPAQAASMTSRDSLRERANATGAQTINANTPANPGTNHSAISTMQYARKAITTAGTIRSADSRERNSPTQSEAHPRATARTHDDTTRSAALSKTKATGSRTPPIRNRTNADAFAAFARRQPGEKDAHRPTATRKTAFANTDASRAYVKTPSNRGKTAVFMADDESSRRARASAERTNTAFSFESRQTEASPRASPLGSFSLSARAAACSRSVNAIIPHPSSYS